MHTSESLKHTCLVCLVSGVISVSHTDGGPQHYDVAKPTDTDVNAFRQCLLQGIQVRGVEHSLRLLSEINVIRILSDCATCLYTTLQYCDGQRR